MLAIETEATQLRLCSVKAQVRPRRNRSSLPLRRGNKEREWPATRNPDGQSTNNEDRVPTLATVVNFSRLTLCVNCEAGSKNKYRLIYGNKSLN